MTTTTKNTTILGLLSGYALALFAGPIEISPTWIHAAVSIVYTIILFAAISHARNRDARGPVPLTWTVAIVPFLGFIGLLVMPDRPGMAISVCLVLAVVLVTTVAEIGALARFHAARAVLPAREPGEWEGMIIGTAIEPIKPGEVVSVVYRSGKGGGAYVQRARAEDCDGRPSNGPVFDSSSGE